MTRRYPYASAALQAAKITHLTALEQQREDQALGAALRRSVKAMPAGWSGPSFAIGPMKAIAAVAPPQNAMSFILLETPIQAESNTLLLALEALADALEARAAK